MQGHWVVKWTFQPGLVPTTMAKGFECLASGTAKRASYRPASGSTLISKTLISRTRVVASCTKTPRLRRRSACDFSRAGGRPALSKQQSAWRHSADGQSCFAREVVLLVQHGSTQARRWVVSTQDSAALFDGNPAAYSETEREPDQPNDGQGVYSAQKSPGLLVP